LWLRFRLLFFFSSRRRHTRFSRDWSSDVCSSDLRADTERAALLEEERTATDPHRIAEIHVRLADIDAHSAEARAATILAGLGFDDEAQRRPASSFSGGWRMRVALAARSEEHTSELQSRENLVCRLLLEKKINA